MFSDPKSARGGEGGPDDSRPVPELGREEIAGDFEVLSELLELLARPPAQNEELGPEVVVHPIEVYVHPPRPRPEAQALLDARPLRSPLFRLVPVDLQVTELDVRDELSVQEERRSDARAEGEHNDEAFPTPPGAEAHLGEAGEIRVVPEKDIEAGRVLEQLITSNADPLLGDVRGASNDAAADDAGKPAAHGAFVAEVAHRFPDYLRYPLGGRRRGCRKADAFRHEIARSGLDFRRFDSRAADVDAERFHRAD
jgi:hypothetical protein